MSDPRATRPGWSWRAGRPAVGLPPYSRRRELQQRLRLSQQPDLRADSTDDDGTGPGTCQDGVNSCDGGSSRWTQAPTAVSSAVRGDCRAQRRASPPNATLEVYGYADGTPDLDGGNYVDADLTQLSSGDFGFSGSVPPATGNSYRFAAVYDSNGRGGRLRHRAQRGLRAGQREHAGTGLGCRPERAHRRADLDLLQHHDRAPARPGITLLFAAGIVAYDIRTGGPLTQPTDFELRLRRLRCRLAGSRFIDAGSPMGQLTLVPVGSVPETEITNSWLYAPSGVTAISNQGAFFFSFTDGTSAKPEYPAGSCAVTYAPPPGFPTDLTINGVDGGPAWGGRRKLGPRDRMSWPGRMTPGRLPPASSSSETSSRSTIWRPRDRLSSIPCRPPSLQLNLSPLMLEDSTQCRSAPAISSAKKSCTLNVTSLYEDARKPRSTPYEGGTTVSRLSASAPGASPPGARAERFSSAAPTPSAANPACSRMR